MLPTITIGFQKKRVKLSRTKKKTDTPFSLKKIKNQYTLYKHDTPFLHPVSLLHVPFHAPDQLFLNICDRCIYNCTFCNLPTKSRLHTLTPERFLTIVHNAMNKHHFQAIALTSGIYPNNAKIIKHFTSLISSLKNQYPEMPVGVEPTVFQKKDILDLYHAGADEIKINIQTSTNQLFQALCPDFDYQQILKMLQEAVAVFGRGKVTSNIIFGFGETEYDRYEALQRLTRIGVIPSLRKLHVSRQNKKRLEYTLSTRLHPPTSKEMISGALYLKQSLKHQNLSIQQLRTMCYPCACCDIIPFSDV